MKGAISVSSDYTYSFEKNGFCLHVHERVHQIFDAARQTAPHDHEKFGVLIGSKTVDEEQYWIEHVTQPLPRDQSTRTSFTMMDPGHQKALDKFFKKSGGQNIYMGTWHTHPQKFPTPSHIDRSDWRSCIRRNIDRQLFFFIIGTEQNKAYFRGERNFLSLEQVND